MGDFGIVLTVIFGILILLAIISAYLILFDIFLKLESALIFILNCFAKFSKWLYAKLKAKLPVKTSEKATGFSLFNPTIVLMFGICILFVGYILFTLLTAADLYECRQIIVYSTCIGAFANLLTNGIDFQGNTSYAAMAAAAFGSFLSYVYMKYTVNNLEDLITHKVPRWIAFVLLNVVFIVGSSLLASNLASFFSNAGNWIFSIYANLVSKISNTDVQTFWDALPIIGSVLLVAPIFVTGIVTLIITVREYLASLFYGIASFLLLLAISLSFKFLALLIPDSVQLPTIQIPRFIADCFVFVSVFAVDYIRVDEKANSKFKDVVESLADEAKDFLLSLIGR